jgi:hypothetical protein
VNSNGWQRGRRSSFLPLSPRFFSRVRCPPAPPASLAPFLQQHCADCHDAATKEGGFDVTSLDSDLTDIAVFAKWERIHDRVRDGEMPPARPGRTADRSKECVPQDSGCRPDDRACCQERDGAAAFEPIRVRADAESVAGCPRPGGRDAAGDGKSHGFDNIGEALDLSPVQMQRYLQAAQLALDAAVQFGPQPEPRVEELRFDSGRNKQFIGEHWHRREDGAVVFYLEGGYPGIKVQEFRVPTPGVYRVRLHVASHQSDRPIAFAVHFGRDSLEEPAALHSYREAQPGAVQVDELTAELKKDDTLRLFVHGLDPSVNHWAAVNRKAPSSPVPVWPC